MSCYDIDDYKQTIVYLFFSAAKILISPCHYHYLAALASENTRPRQEQSLWRITTARLHNTNAGRILHQDCNLDECRRRTGRASFGAHRVRESRLSPHVA